MIKPAALREVVKAAIPSLSQNPDKLLVFADDGKVVASGTAALSFEYRYTLNLILTDLTGSADTVMAAVLEWAKVNQPELVANDEHNSLTFEVDHINHEAYDLSIKLPLSEAVKVSRGAGGALTFSHVQENAPEWMHTGTLVQNG